MVAALSIALMMFIHAGPGRERLRVGDEAVSLALGGGPDPVLAARDEAALGEWYKLVEDSAKGDPDALERGRKALEASGKLLYLAPWTRVKIVHAFEITAPDNTGIVPLADTARESTRGTR